jgi:hypothetical protein
VGESHEPARRPAPKGSPFASLVDEVPALCADWPPESAALPILLARGSGYVRLSAAVETGSACSHSRQATERLSDSQRREPASSAGLRLLQQRLKRRLWHPGSHLESQRRVAVPADRDTSPGSVDLRSRPAATCAERDVIAEREHRLPRSRLRSPQGRETHSNRDRQPNAHTAHRERGEVRISPRITSLGHGGCLDRVFVGCRFGSRSARCGRSTR